jgi:hypothetical protein
MSTKVTIATSTGFLWLALVSHFGAGLVGLITGFASLAVRKGGVTHKRLGIVFTYSMIFSGLSAAGIAIYSASGTVIGALLSVYFVFTGTTAVKPLGRGSREVGIVAMLLAFVIAIASLKNGLTAWDSPGHALGGVPAGMLFFMGTVCLLAAIGDARMLRAAQPFTGPRRLARHLWRMCFGLFIASGSFFLGQMKFVPEPFRMLPLLMVLAFAPLIALLYWMWRVRLRKQLSGLVVGPRPATAAPGTG